MRFLLLACSLAIGACSHPHSEVSESSLPTTPTRTPITVDSPRALYEQCRSGAVHLAGASETIEEALALAKKIARTAPKAMKEALGDAETMIDSAGAGIADFVTEPPSFEQFQKSIVAQDEKRLKAVQAANDGLHDLDEARGIVESISEDAKGPLKTQVTSLTSMFDVCVQDLEDAIGSLGGKIEKND